MSVAVGTNGVSTNLTVAEAAAMSSELALQRLETPTDGLGADAVARRRAVAGRNVIAVRRVRVWEVLGRQLRSALLPLPVVTAALSLRADLATSRAVPSVQGRIS